VVHTLSKPEIVLCDLDGVVWLGGQPIAGSVAAIERLRKSGRRVVFVTNSSAPTIADHTAALAAIGIVATGDVISSASAAAQLIVAGERVLVCGGRGIAEAVTSKGALAIAGDDDDGASAGVHAVIVGFHREFDYHRLQLATAAVRAGARLIATNRDPLFPTPTGPIPGGGSIVAAVATATGVEPVTAGKPYPPMARTVRAALVDAIDGEKSLARRLIVVGDQVSTDGRFATELECRFALVRSGNTAPGEPVDLKPSFDAADLGTIARMIVDR
jgi:HAD superfamily hydrolase (TIGR01450 family)